MAVTQNLFDGLGTKIIRNNHYAIEKYDVIPESMAQRKIKLRNGNDNKDALSIPLNNISK